MSILKSIIFSTCELQSQRDFDELQHPSVFIRNIAVFSEKTNVPHLPNQSMVAISVMKLWHWKLGQGHPNLISY